MSEKRVTNYYGGDNGPIKPRQWCKAKSATDPSKGQRYCNYANYYCCGDQGRAGSAFNERDPGSTDNVNNERLRQQRFDEPSGLKQRRIGQRVKYVEHGSVGGVIKNRTDRTDEYHELEDVADVPTTRRSEVLCVDMVRRNCRLRKVVEQIVGEHLDRRHRQKRQKQAGAEHAEHVTEIGTRPHFDVFRDVAKDFTPFNDAVLKHQQALF